MPASLVLAGTLLLPLCPARARVEHGAPGDTPVAVVEAVQAALAGLEGPTGVPGEASAPSLPRDLAADWAVLDPAAAPTHDLPGAARELLGAGFDTLDPEQRAGVEEVLGRLFAARYAGIADWADGNGIEPPAVREQAEDRARVVSRVPSAEGGFEIRYELRETKEGWRIVDVSAESREEVLHARLDLGAVLAEAGYEGLVERVEQRVECYGRSPSDVVHFLQSALTGAMRDATALGFDGRRRLLAPVVADTHDMSFIPWFVLRKDWQGLDDAQRDRFRAVFGELSLDTYAARFDGYDGERFEVREEAEGRRGIRLVRSVLVQKDGSEIHFDYQLRRTDGRWAIVNIVVDGVSDLAVKQAEYGSVLERDGFPALIAQVEGKIERLRSGKDEE